MTATDNLEFKSIREDDWGSLLDCLSNGGLADAHTMKCVLVLGPEALTSSTGSILQNDFCQVIWKRLQDEKRNLPPTCEGYSFFSIMEMFIEQFRGNEGALYKKLFEPIYRIENLNSAFIKKLPYIPFPLIINTSPDNLLPLAFDQAGIKGRQTEHYDYNFNARPKLLMPSLNSPIIYNLFGRFNYPPSTIRTNTHLLDFIFEILSHKGQQQLDQVVKTGISGATHFVFLGFDFESWHLRVFLRFFGIKKNSEKFSFAEPWKLKSREAVQNFEQLFNVTFVRENAEQFIDQLYAKCTEPNSQVMIRQRSDGKLSDEQKKFHLIRLLEGGDKEDIQATLNQWKTYVDEAKDSSTNVSTKIAEWNRMRKEGSLSKNDIVAFIASLIKQIEIDFL